jgi:Flp pilus assembly protein TadD
MLRAVVVLTVLLSLTGCAMQPATSSGDGQSEQLQTRLEGDKQKSFLQDYAALLSESGNHAEAARILEELRREDPSDLGITRQIADVYERTGQLELALLAREGVYRGGGDPLQDGAELARVALLNRRYGLAREVYHGWLAEARPNSSRQVSAMNNLGYSYLLEHDMENARAWFERALAIDPLHGRARANLELLRQLQTESR